MAYRSTIFFAFRFCLTPFLLLTCLIECWTTKPKLREQLVHLVKMLSFLILLLNLDEKADDSVSRNPMFLRVYEWLWRISKLLLMPLCSLPKARDVNNHGSPTKETRVVRDIVWTVGRQWKRSVLYPESRLRERPAETSVPGRKPHRSLSIENNSTIVY